MKLAAIFLIFLLCLSLSAQQTSTTSVLELYEQSMKAKEEKKYPEYLKIAEQLSSIAPGHPGIRFLLAEANVLNNDLASAKRNLLNAARAGVVIGTDRLTTFEKIQDSNEYREAVEMFSKNKQPIGASEIAFKIPQKDLIAEGMAYDPETKSFFVSSTYCRKIVEIDASAKARDFISEKQDGIWGVVGMEVDAKRRHLWANSGNLEADTGLKYLEPDTVGHTAIHKYDLKTKKLIKKYTLAVKGERHFFNDLAISKSGDVYITDSEEGSVYRILSVKDEVELFVKPQQMNYPNGIALSEDDANLYVGHVEGISVINLNTKKVNLVKTPENVATTSIDGMIYYDHSLIVNQALTGVERVVRFYLSKEPDRIDKLEILQTNHPTFVLPTTGVLAGNDFYYIANSQLRSFDEQGKIFPEDKLQETIILKLAL